MPVINQLFPCIVPPEIQVELDKQTHICKAIFDWITGVKQSLRSGEDTDQVFRAPRTPAYQRRKKHCKIKPIPEEAGSDADNTFDVSSSSTCSSISSVISEVSARRSRRNAAVKANIHIKAHVNTKLATKLRQPTPEPEGDVQSGIVTHSYDSFSTSDNPPSKKICLDRDSSVESLKKVVINPGKVTSVTGLDNTSIAAGDIDDDSDGDIVLSKISRNIGGKCSGSILNVGTVPSVPTLGCRQVSPDSCKPGEVSSVSEHGPNLRAKRDTESIQSTRGRPRTQKERRKRTQLRLKDNSKQPGSLVKEQDFNSHADHTVEDTLCVDTAVKRVRKETVSMIPCKLSLLSNDHKLKMKAVVSLSHINVSNNSVNFVLALSKEGTEVGSVKERNVTEKLNDSITGEPPVTDSNVTVTKQSAVETEKEQRTDVTSQHDVTPQHVVIEKPTAAVGNKDEGSSGSSHVTKLDVTITEPIVVTQCEVAAVSKKVSSGEVKRQSEDSLNKTTENTMKPEFETSTNRLTSDQINKTHLKKTKDIASVKNLGEKNCTSFSSKAGGEYRSLRKSLDLSKNNTQSPSRSILENTFTHSPGKTLSPSVALADISNTMNTSACLRDNFLKDFKKTPKNVGSSHITSTPWFSGFDGSSSMNNSLNWNCKVVLGSSKSSDKAHKTPCRSPIVFSPYAKESVKNRVAKFENLNTLVEVTDENTDPVVQPQSVRVTRTKTRAMAAAAAAAAKNAASDTSLCESTRKNYNAVQTSARKSLKKALRMSASKLKKGFLTPNSSHDENKLYSMLTSSMKKYNNVVIGMDTFLPRVNKQQGTQDLERKKEEEQRRQKERAEEACRKREIMLNAKAMEKKKRNDEKIQKVLEKREAQQREELERRLRLEREKEEKMVRMMQTRDEKLREEQLLKRLQLQQKLQEVEERRRQEEAMRLARIREQEEQEARKKEQLEKERVAEEKAAAREQALLQKQKANTTFTYQPGSSKPNKQEAGPMNQTYNLEDEVTNYRISDVGANSDDDLTIKHAVPKWAKSYQKTAHSFSDFMAQTYVPGELLLKLFGGSEDPDLTCLLGLTAKQVADCRRKSSMFPLRQKQLTLKC